MKYCKKCGAELVDEAVICPKCGCAVEDQPVTSNVPAWQLKTNKSLLKYVLLSLITFGIYGLVVMTSVSEDINTIASQHDGKKTMHYCLLFFIVGPLTLGIAYLVWEHKICARIGAELQRRNINYKLSPADFWLWNVLGILIIVGPLVYRYKMFKAMNALASDYNNVG